jgi:RNA polymerase sigma factor (sigma-70 family)
MADFAQLVEHESRGLIAAVAAIVGDRHRAEEIVQDAFERCYRRWRRVAHLDRPGAWVRRVAINAAISATRRSASERRAIERMSARTATSTVTDPSAGLDDAGVWTAVRALPGDQAAAIALRYGADLSIDEVAATLLVSTSAAKSLLHRGRLALRESPALQSYAE